nr:EOG090X0E8U [Ilyocryptus agilis]
MSSTAKQDRDSIETSDSEVSETDLPVLHSIVNKGTIDRDAVSEMNERQAIRQELSNLSFEELQKLKEKIGSKKFNQTLNGANNEQKKKVEFKRLNPNRPREMSSKIRKVEAKPAIQVAKVYRNDPRFDGLCGEFRERLFHKNYEFIGKMKEKELAKLKEELNEENDARKIEKIKYLIQRMENQIKAEKKRKEEEEKQLIERQAALESLKQGISPHYASKSEKSMERKKVQFDKLKEEGRLQQYMAKKRKHNAQRQRKYLPSDRQDD